MVDIGGVIKMYMYKHNLRQKDLALKVNVDQRTISNYCNNKTNPDYETLSKICNELNINLNKLLQIQNRDDTTFLIRNSEEMVLIDAFRAIEHKTHKTEFLNSFLALANLLK